MRVTLDLSQLVADGKLSTGEALHLATLGETDDKPTAPEAVLSKMPVAAKGRVFANVAMIFGALAVAVGVELLHPSVVVGGALAIMALLAGALLRQRSDEAWLLLAHALAIGGALGACLAFELQFPTLQSGLLFVGLFLGATAFYFRSGVIAAFAPLALGSWLGSGAGYWHASYSIAITQPFVTIVVFSAFSAGLFGLLYRFDQYVLVITVMARVSFFLANFGFWVGSLWGDNFGAGTFATALQKSSAPAIPAVAFSAGWAAALLIALVVGLRTQRRFISNSAIVFLAIHFYTQIFETFGAKPVVVICCGLLLVAFAFCLVRFNIWQKRRPAGDRSEGPSSGGVSLGLDRSAANS
jgi:hypothetical protein